LATHGYTGATKAGDGVPNDTTNPLGEVLRKGEPIVFHGRAERQSRYPSLAARFTVEGDSMVIPMLYEGAATGAIYLNFQGSSGYGEGDRDYLRSIGVQCGSALERAQLIEQAADLAATQQARAAELETVVEAIGDGLLVGDASGQVILKNRAATRLLGRVPALLSELPDRVADAPGERVAADRYLAHSPKRPQDWLEITAFPVTRTSSTSDVVLIRDVTRAIEADLQRDAFLGVLSHELRTPITTIVAGVNLLLQSEPRGEDLNRELLNDIDAESTRLHRIVDDLLVLTRSERGALDVSGEPVLVHRLVQSVVERERATSPEVEISLQNDDDLAPVEAEPTYVQQIVRNLLSNAIKYGRAPGQPIEVVVSGADGVVETRVLDRGVGIGPGEADRLFTLFYRNPKVIGSAPGAGIGLYVCRLLTEAMGGRTWAKPRTGGGSEFGFALPTMGDGGPLEDDASSRSGNRIPAALLPPEAQ
ncbi:MAG: ATP-binding protein, partial [Candidatus Limnocylindrales bacterium]